MPFRPDRLKALREAKGLSQEQLGQKAGLHHSIITKSEKGKNLPRSDALDKLALALDCTMDYLHGRGYDDVSPAVAAREMALDVFVAQEGVTDEQRAMCRRLLQHPDAPRTAQGWRSLLEMMELGRGPVSPGASLSLVEGRPPTKKAVGVARRQD